MLPVFVIVVLKLMLWAVKSTIINETIFDFRNEKHGIPFLPHVDLHKDDTWGERRREKAEKIFKNLAMMWETKINGKSDDLLPKKKKQDSYEKEENKKKEESVPKEQLFGKDEKNIMPDFVKEEFEKQRDLLGKDEKFIQPKFVSEELKNLHKIDLLGKDEKDISPKYLEDVKGLQKKEILAFKKELKRKPKLIGAEEYGVDLLGQTNEEKEKAVGKKEKLASVINKESEDLEKTVEELLPFLGKEKEERQQKVELKEIKAPKHVLLTSAVGKKFGNGLKMLNENPVVSKTSEEVKGEEDTSSSDEEEEEMMGTKERLLKSEKEKVEEVEKEFAEEQKLFAEAEKKWESEIQKIVMQEIEKKKKQKTAEKEEVEEELKEPYETVFTPPDEVTATVEPETKKKGEFNPLLDFKFEDSEDDKKFPKAEKVLPVPKRVQEPAEIFNHQKEPESEYEEMRPEIQPFFQRLDDVNFRSKFLEEEEQWMKLKQWAAKKLFKPGKKKDGQIY